MDFKLIYFCSLKVTKKLTGQKGFPPYQRVNFEE